MKKRKTVAGNACPKCGRAIDPAALICPVCGEPVLTQKTAQGKGKKAPGILGTFFSGVCSLLLTVSMALYVLLLFIHALNENVKIPSLGPLPGDWLAAFLDSWYPLIIGGALVLLPILVILFINAHRIRRAFACVGVSAILSALLSAASGFICTWSLKLLPGEWQDTLINATSVFKGFTMVCAAALLVIGATCLSICSCITAVKGGRHENGT